MTAEQRYNDSLLALKRAEVTSELERQGFTVELGGWLGGERAQLVAMKPGERTEVYEFELPSHLRANSSQIRKLRKLAAEKEYEFKLVVVTPPKRVQVTVEGLERVLLAALRDRIASARLASSDVTVDEVADVEIEALSAVGDGLDVAGRGVALTSFDDFLFRFDITLDGERQLRGLRRLDIDATPL